MKKTDDLRIVGTRALLTPDKLQQEFAITDVAAGCVAETRVAIKDLLSGHDDRLLVVIGPCSIHDPLAAREYAQKLLPWQRQLSDDLLIVMRVYFEKPRTTGGWKGLINDPGLDCSFRINDGLRQARSLLLELAQQGLPAGTEYLDPISPQFVADLVAWGAIGARTTESQVHRELASGLSCPVGFKNGTDGNIKIAVDAIGFSAQPHEFLSITKQGQSAIFSTCGNPDCHLIMRGGKTPNYTPEHIDGSVLQLTQRGLNPRLMIDCSHANSGKKSAQQIAVCEHLAAQIAAGEQRVFGLMLESNLIGERQDLDPKQPDRLRYGQSITDPCLSWEQSVPLLELLAKATRHRRQRHAARSAARS